MSHSMLGRAAERGNQRLSVSIAQRRDTRRQIVGLREEERLGKVLKERARMREKAMERERRIVRGRGISCGCERGCCMDGHVRCFRIGQQ